MSESDINQIIEKLPDDIKEINLSSKHIKKLPNLSRFKNLKILDISNNNITELPILPESIEYLFIYNNKLTNIYKIPNSVKYLYCYFNSLTHLIINENINLTHLYCFGNKLKSIDLPINLQILLCASNEITFLDLDKLKNLKKLNCTNNILSKSQVFPLTVDILYY
jgi:Leucine-rich repeat (LRR) protein